MNLRPRPGLADASHSLADALRRRLRASDVWFIALALLVGVIAGLLTLLQSSLAHGAQALLYGLEADERLSAMSELSVHQLLVLPLGGLLVGLLGMAARARKRQLVDAVEANALYGGRMSMRDNLIVSVQTLFSNGVGASVGLEAAYTQMGAGSGSHLGRVLRLRRADIRTLVGAGAGAAIAAAFGAPLAGAFYAFEIVIGAYSPSALAPVAVASLGAVFVSQLAGVQPYLLPASAASALEARDYVLYALLGVLCALLAVAVMRLIGAIEQAINRSPLPRWARPVAGGLLLIPLALITPQVLSSGHGALHLDLTSPTSLRWLGILLLLKCLGSAISLGFGFRGGLFFASLFMGSLVGGLFAGVLNLGSGMALVDGTAASLAGMAAMAAAVIGAPMTMAMLVLEGTHDFVLASAVMVAVLVANTIVRQIFGYSFSTWRLHLRGETIKSARDVGWVKHLSAGRMMQKDVHPLAATTSVAEFRRRFPLGSGTRVVLEDENGHYAGLVTLAAAYADGVNADAAIVDYAGNRDVALPADTDVVTAMRQFDLTQSDELAVVDDQGKVLGVLSESFVRKRYAEELDKRQRELMGERVDD
ncbi:MULTISPECIES: chloride channel protein [Xanthomonas]|uniref:CBS domain-containing protein n=7 Tax=Xanthomonas TaxID=338 RepID=A0A6N7Q6M5_9XANT|nr:MULTISPECIES: chloride channel protein [Xanthomonas]KAA8920518.1 chloride channel protein [Xanthomonas sontii]KAB7780366.1 chloride channel protein [Xanthomonas sp. LMG 12459]MCW0381110.1 Voltage-gated ClC-type chloride channel ClcB [Xanthomonas sacchari]MCW0394381.1 Voltage-gated ClC-type chloride channel ClcB [Xanthomonas sacchari]MCW0397957.1 Voltage-gated ClC-type chloride channel ClcB [Xanthomonas sacchari]